jgi:hypothetical protein
MGARGAAIIAEPLPPEAPGSGGRTRPIWLAPEAAGTEPVAAVVPEPGNEGRVMPMEVAGAAAATGDCLPVAAEDWPGKLGRVMPIDDVGAGAGLALEPPNHPPQLEPEPLDAEPPRDGRDRPSDEDDDERPELLLECEEEEQQPGLAWAPSSGANAPPRLSESVTAAASAARAMNGGR